MHPETKVPTQFLQKRPPASLVRSLVHMCVGQSKFLQHQTREQVHHEHEPITTLSVH